jgi:hypothetical protein
MRIAAASPGRTRRPPSQPEHQVAPAHPTRSFSEPIHQTDDTED